MRTEFVILHEGNGREKKNNFFFLVWIFFLYIYIFFFIFFKLLAIVVVVLPPMITRKPLNNFENNTSVSTLERRSPQICYITVNPLAPPSSHRNFRTFFSGIRPIVLRMWNVVSESLLHLWQIKQHQFRRGEVTSNRPRSKVDFWGKSQKKKIHPSSPRR